MFSAIVAPLRKIIHWLVASNSPNQLAAGFTLGMVLGLVPKGNLIALSLLVLVFSLRCNKGLSLVAVVMFSCVATWTDPFAHKLGLALLNAPTLQANYASMFSLPAGPWIGFHNTVVAGSLMMGLYATYPVYWCVRAICSALPRRAAR